MAMLALHCVLVHHSLIHFRMLCTCLIVTGKARRASFGDIDSAELFKATNGEEGEKLCKINHVFMCHKRALACSQAP